MWRREKAFHGSMGWVVQAKTSLQRIFLASARLVRLLCPVKEQSLRSKQRQNQYLLIFWNLLVFTFVPFQSSPSSRKMCFFVPHGESPKQRSAAWLKSLAGLVQADVSNNNNG